MAAKRFADTSSEEIENKRMKLNSVNTLRANKKCANTLKSYLRENNNREDFELLEVTELSKLLEKFYVDLRKPDGDLYKTTSLESIRSGINRYLRSPPYNRDIDIVKDDAFKEANKNFSAVLAECKRAGLGTIEHHPHIVASDLHKLYTSLHLSPKTPNGLFNKVQFDIRLYFFRRGAENMVAMKKDTFVVKTNPKGLKYVAKACDEITKNHRETDKEDRSGLMPETPGSPYCPVSSFEAYIRHLHPANDRLWQKPRDSFDDDQDVWYCNTAVGEKPLKSFMSDLSVACDLSKNYTNHCIRATGATILSKNMFGAAQIMAVTGHKSVQSLSVYQRVDDEEKLMMGNTLSNSLAPQQAPQLALPAPQPQLALPAPEQAHLAVAVPHPKETLRANTGSLNQVSLPEMADVDLNDILGDFSEVIDVRTINHASQRHSNCFYRPVTIIQNLTINK